MDNILLTSDLCALLIGLFIAQIDVFSTISY